MNPDRARQRDAHREARQPQRTIDELHAAVEANPTDADAWLELGSALGRHGTAEAALDALDRAILLAPADPDAAFERALALSRVGCLDDATAALEELLAEHPLDGPALLVLGDVRYRQARVEDAIALWQRAEELLDDPAAVSDAIENLALAYQRLGRRGDERAAWRRILVRAPGHPTALHMLAALGDAPAPDRATDAHLVYLFDAFAPEFDETLRSLDYDAPARLATLIETTLGSSARSSPAPPPTAMLDVLDAGCGTGLCAVHLRPWARRLTGLDLSPAMLQRAGARGLYDELVCAEITDHLLSHLASFDLVCACDVLNYAGDLTASLTSIAGALRPGGTAAWTLERLTEPHDARDGFRLEPHGRYSHSRDYIERIAITAGLRVETLVETPIRNESGRAVAGWSVVARPG